MIRSQRAVRHTDDEPTEQFPAVEPGAPPRERAPAPSILEQMGGIAGVVYSSIPVAVFIPVNILAGLQVALIAALGAGGLIAVVRLVRRDALQPAISGLIAVGVCAFLANRTGEARDFYLPGLIYSGVLCLAFLGSAAVRWPLAGVVWHAINGDGHGWRRDRRLLRAYTLASLLWAVVFGARLVVQGWLYRVDEADWLGVARLLMGYPLFGVALLVTFWAVRRARRPSPEPGGA
ncbi:DUF3159 domain-containing protein [Pseudonocardia asaccharolytica]|uniref:Membrane protein n=1 Tax=Pseudonocardia asaccharolytica DSM 44247 = NBRC 16224 TaxID=1123024 RepID=A0A511D533_9PSEU|nr:DUF3159 domain-containing protein [Pseudonocardia asaccharolytica]GEL18038.1 membrane protein [Pseudonocardia asaccharolytica DSM 44247 = NBRC 16224]